MSRCRDGRHRDRELIKARERSRDVPIIFLTAAERDLAEVFAGYEAGAVDYLLNPFDPLVLRSKVKVFADLDRHRRQLRRSDDWCATRSRPRRVGWRSVTSTVSPCRSTRRWSASPARRPRC